MQAVAYLNAKGVKMAEYLETTKRVVIVLSAFRCRRVRKGPPFCGQAPRRHRRANYKWVQLLAVLFPLPNLPRFTSCARLSVYPPISPLLVLPFAAHLFLVLF